MEKRITEIIEEEIKQWSQVLAPDLQLDEEKSKAQLKAEEEKSDYDLEIDEEDLESKKAIVLDLVEVLRNGKYKNRNISIFDNPSRKTIKCIIFLTYIYDNPNEIKAEIEKYKEQVSRDNRDLRIYSEEYETKFAHYAEILILQDAFEKHKAKEEKDKAKKKDGYLKQLPFKVDESTKKQLEFLGNILSLEEMQNFMNLYRSLLYLDNIISDDNKGNERKTLSNEELEMDKKQIIEWLRDQGLNPDANVRKQLVFLSNLEGMDDSNRVESFINKCVELIECENDDNLLRRNQEENKKKFLELAKITFEEYINENKKKDRNKTSNNRVEYIYSIYKEFPMYSPFKIAQIFTMSHFKPNRREGFRTDRRANKRRIDAYKALKAKSLYERIMIAEALKGEFDKKWIQGLPQSEWEDFVEALRYNKDIASEKNISDMLMWYYDKYRIENTIPPILDIENGYSIPEIRFTFWGEVQNLAQTPKGRMVLPTIEKKVSGVFSEKDLRKYPMVGNVEKTGTSEDANSKEQMTQAGGKAGFDVID